MSVSWQSIPFDNSEIDIINKVCEATDQKPKVFIKKAALAFAAYMISEAEKKHGRDTESLSKEVQGGPGTGDPTPGPGEGMGQS